MKKVIFSPSKYIQGFGEIKKLSNYYKKLGNKAAYILVDKFVYDKYKGDIISSFENDNIHFHLELFNKECSENEINKNISLLKEKKCDVILAIGGGKTIDVGKAIAHYSNLPVIVVPTIASTDAPCSSISVIYTENGEFKHYLALRSNPNIVIMDTEVIVNAPTRLLAAGIGDALSTYYEAKACFDSNSNTIAGGKPSKTAITLAKLCLDILFEDAIKSIEACFNKVVTKEFENVIEAITYLSCIGFESGGLAAAHSIHNGLTILNEGANMYHGEKVSFGTITQLVLEKRSLEEIRKVINLCKAIGLPTCLKDLNMDKISKEALYEVAKASTFPTESIHNMPFEITADKVYEAILTADKLGTI